MSPASVEIVLSNGRAEVAVSPADGARISRYLAFTSERTYSWLAPAGDAFPMLPFGSRVEDGRFSFGGHDVQLPSNNPPENHAIHGQAFEQPWQVRRRAKDSLELVYEGGGTAWPWRYQAECNITLRDYALVLTLRLRNLSDTAMPCGVGWHPYFYLTENMHLNAYVAGCWKLDEELIGRSFEPLDAGANPLHGLLPAALEIDAAYAGWSGRAKLHWPEWGAGLQMTTSGADTLILYSPRDADFVCVEPLSNAPNGFNLSGVNSPVPVFRVLKPGEEAMQRTELLPVFAD